jgi:RNA polymerase sigma-70 factor (ECF subfamily)
MGDTVGELASRDPDIRLMLQAQAGEPGAFEQLVRRYRHRILGFLHHLLDDIEEAEDLAQEVFLRVYRARKRYRPCSKFCTWLFTIASNLAMNSLRARRRKPAVSLQSYEAGPSAEELIPDRQVGPAQRAQTLEMGQRIHAALDSLKERQRRALVLNKFEGKSYAETGAAMGLTVKAVKSLLSRARLKLRAALQGYVDADVEAPAEEADAAEAA